MNYLMQKIIGRLIGEFAVEMYDDRLLNAEHFEIRKPLVKRLQERRGSFGMKDGARVRIESDRRRRCPNFSRAFDHGLHYFLMPKM